jgi:hypothetical protein
MPETIAMQPRPIHSESEAPNLPSQSPLEGIADLENLLTKACEDLILRHLTMASTLPVGEFRTKAVLEHIILYIAGYDSAV